MSIRIDKITRGRFGNKILQYNSLVQLGKKYNVKCSMVQNNEITRFFKDIIPYIPSKKSVKLLTCIQILNDEKLDFENYEYKIDDPAYCLHNVFYELTKDDPRDILELKDEFKVNLPNDILNIGIHFRGDDKKRRNDREIPTFEYYKKSIEYVLKKYCEDKKFIFYICTDDTNFNIFNQTINYLKEKKLPIKTGPIVGDKNNYIIDWSILCECDILINNPSTFCVSAGFLGKKNKNILYSKKWIDKNVNHELWHDNGEDEFTWGKQRFGFKFKEFWKTYDNFWINILNNDKHVIINDYP